MTEDQIKAIAWDYARFACSEDTKDDIEQRSQAELIEYDFAKPVIQWLCDRYCIVEREKVMDHYQLALADSEEMDEESDEKVLLELLFGTSMFNQNEE